jgi:Family of unknown function (DUF6029)
MQINRLSWILVVVFFGKLAAQTNGPSLSGNIKSNGNFFVRDNKIGASNTPQYDRQLFGAESWLTLNYSYKGYDAGIRFDLFNNSNLPNPTDSYTAQGIGRWFLHKKVQKLDVSAGYLYDQIGVGTIFRAFEERNLNIDNALYGVRLGYELTENWKIKAFTGKQKFQFDSYGAIIKGAAIDGFIRVDSARGITLSPGAGIVGRTFDNQTISDIVGNVVTYFPKDSIGAQANSYAGSFYNTLTAGNFSWYVETAFKSKDVFNDPNASKLFFNTQKNRVDTTTGKLVNRAGSMLYTNITWTKNKFGATLEGKRTQDFTFRVNPFVTGSRGAINWLPPMARQNSYRLTTRYQPSTQELGEQSAQADLRYAYSKKLQFSVNFSAINDLDGGKLYREMYTEAVYKYKRKWQLLGGIQLQNYNKQVFEGKPDTVHTVTPYAEFLYKITPRRSVRTEIQFMHTKDDLGSWAFGLVEVGIAPHWIFTVSDMYKIKHNTTIDKLHFWTAGVVYAQNSSRFSLDWVKQVDGIVCSGGICRYEPAFNGIKLKVSSNF